MKSFDEYVIGAMAIADKKAATHTAMANDIVGLAKQVSAAVCDLIGCPYSGEQPLCDRCARPVKDENK